MRQTLMPLLLVTAAAAAMVTPWAQAQTRGLTAAPDALGGPVWRARFERDAGPLSVGRGLGTWLVPAPPTPRVRLLGDYQLPTLRLGETGGQRLTGGLLLSLRGPAGGLQSAGSAQPYAGVGYASGSLDGRWGLSADLGITTLRGAERAGGATGLRPTVRLGMNLAF